MVLDHEQARHFISLISKLSFKPPLSFFCFPCLKLIESSGGNVVFGHGCVTDSNKDKDNQADPSNCFVPPTIIDCPKPDSDLMNMEIFGPILPVMPYGGGGKTKKKGSSSSASSNEADNDDQDAIARIHRIDKQPLALYVFATNKRSTEVFLLLPAIVECCGVCVCVLFWHMCVCHVFFYFLLTSDYLPTLPLRRC
jgi:hypothetical protein